MISSNLICFGRKLMAVLLLLGIPMTSVLAQQPAAPTAAVAPAPAAAPVEATAKAAPALPAGSTAKLGWNVPPKWSDVEQKGQYASVPGREANVLIEDAGREWRVLRNGPLTFYSGIIILVVPTILLLIFFAKGEIKMRSSLTGRLIERFNSAERVAHWTMGLSFVALALTGLALLFGKHVLMPWLGAAAFAGVANVAIKIHNFVGPLFMFSMVVFVVLFIRDNLWRAYDVAWLAKLGGVFSGEHVPSGRFNAGEKGWFWMGVVLCGTIASVTGAILLFPNWNTSRELMGEANLIHAGVGSLFVAMSFVHIYLGTIGMAGAYQAMRTGKVDEAWAKEHHELWYEDLKSGARPGKEPGVAQPAAGDD